MTVSTIAVAFASGASLSAPTPIPGTLVGISVPANWTPAVLTFQTSINGNAPVEVYREGNPYTLSVTAPSFSQENANYWGGVSLLTIRSGTAAVSGAVPQSQAVVLTVSYETDD